MSFRDMTSFIVFAKLTLWTCPYYLPTPLLALWGIIFPIKCFPGLMFAQMTLPVNLRYYGFCLFLRNLDFSLQGEGQIFSGKPTEGIYMPLEFSWPMENGKSIVLKGSCPAMEDR